MTKYTAGDIARWNQIAYGNVLNAREFERLCNKFIEGQTFDEYSAFVFRSLIESSWHYTPEEAAERMEWEEYWLNDYYSRKEPVSSCAAEVGFGCG